MAGSNRLEKGFEDFGEEVEELGKKAELKGKQLEKGWNSTFGFVGPVISSILGVIALAIGIWILDLAAMSTGILFLQRIGFFLLENIALFFVLFLVFGYADYFSRAYSRAFRPFSPLVAAAGVVVAVWVIANALVIASGPLGLEAGQGAAQFVLGKLFWIFLFFAIIGYIALVAGRHPAGLKQEVVAMKKQKKAVQGAGPKRLYRSGKDKILGGVCGGIAEYFNIDPVLIRLLWVVGTLISLGTGILLYIIAWIIIPRNPGNKWD